MISSLIISTKDRQELALNTLRSFQEVNRPRGLEYVVYDQSEAPTAYPGARVCGPPEVAAYIEQLAAHGFPQELLEFALVGGYGGYRNVALLDTIGQHVLSTDDDTLCGFVEPPGRQPGFISADPQPIHLGFKNRAEWQAQFKTAPVDVIGEHEKILGRTTGDGFTVRIAAAGIVGDAAATYNHVSLVKPDEYEALKSREIMQAVQQLTLSNPHSTQTWLRTIQYSFDNTAPLPPFPPNGRGECQIFATLLRHLRTEIIAYLPWAVLHVPPEGRQFKRQLEVELDTVLNGLIEHIPGGALPQIASKLIEFGVKDSKEAAALVTHLHHQGQEIFRQLLPQLLETSEVKGSWRKDAQDYLTALDHPFWKDMGADKIEGFQHQAKMYGLMLLNWYDIYDCARRLQKQGVRISREPV